MIESIFIAMKVAIINITGGGMSGALVVLFRLTRRAFDSFSGIQCASFPSVLRGCGYTARKEDLGYSVRWGPGAWVEAVERIYGFR